jgi:hypothetical protein
MRTRKWLAWTIALAWIGFVMTMIGFNYEHKSQPYYAYSIVFSDDGDSCHNPTGSLEFTTLYFHRTTGSPMVCEAVGHTRPGTVSPLDGGGFFTPTEVADISSFVAELARDGLKAEDQQRVQQSARQIAERKNIPGSPNPSAFLSVLIVIGISLMGAASLLPAVAWVRKLVTKRAAC